MTSFIFKSRSLDEIQIERDGGGGRFFWAKLDTTSKHHIVPHYVTFRVPFFRNKNGTKHCFKKSFPLISREKFFELNLFRRSIVNDLTSLPDVVWQLRN